MCKNQMHVFLSPTVITRYYKIVTVRTFHASLLTTSILTCMQPLVPYADSDEDDEDQTHMQTIMTEDNAGGTILDGRSVYTSLGVRRSAPQKGDWVCSVHVSLVECDSLLDVLDEAVKLLATADIHLEAVERSSLHISLTRPIVLRASERSTLMDVARTAVRSFASESSHVPQRPALSLSFSQFALLSSEEGDRLYFVAEIGQGWSRLRLLTDCLDRSLIESRIGRPYYEEARFHTSFASIKVDSTGEAQKGVELLNNSLVTRLRAAGVMVTNTIDVAMGTQTVMIPIST